MLLYKLSTGSCTAVRHLLNDLIQINPTIIVLSISGLVKMVHIKAKVFDQVIQAQAGIGE